MVSVLSCPVVVVVVVGSWNGDHRVIIASSLLDSDGGGGEIFYLLYFSLWNCFDWKNDIGFVCLFFFFFSIFALGLRNDISFSNL